jgi:hypothetical protein
VFRRFDRYTQNFAYALRGGRAAHRTAVRLGVAFEHRFSERLAAGVTASAAVRAGQGLADERQLRIRIHTKFYGGEPQSQPEQQAHAAQKQRGY